MMFLLPQVPVNADGSFLAFGQGTSGTVTCAVDTRPGGGSVALKSIPVTLREEDRDRVIQQVRAIRLCEHEPYIAGCMPYWDGGRNPGCGLALP
jgi:hypothetical protein